MGSITARLINNGSLVKHSYPLFLKDSIQYEVIMGSYAYGINNDDSDMDIYGFCIPPKNIVFPHVDGYIKDFGTKPPSFDQYQQHHIYDINDIKKIKEYDINMYNIVKYLHLCMENNPNMVDSLFVPQRCVLHITKIGEHIRSNRKSFLHKGCYHKLKGYAFSQKNKLITKDPIGKRKEMIEKYGMDVKFAYHVVRLLNECEQILLTGDLDLEQDKERLKDIRAGNWSIEKINEFFEEKEKYLERLYETSTLQYEPDENKIKSLLLECLEIHYGSLDNLIKIQEADEGKIIQEIRQVFNKYNM